MSHVMTVLGAVKPQELGCTDAHSHAWIEPVGGVSLKGLIHNDEQGICRDLQAFRENGGSALVDCQPGGCGRNASRLKSISQKTGVNIIACTGFHLRRYYPQDSALWTMPPDHAYDYFREECSSGLVECRGDGEPVYPGFIKIAAELSKSESPMELFRAISQISKETGLAIEMHTEKGAAVEEFLDFFLDQRVPMERLIFCHVDKRPDFKLHQELASAGVLLEYDTFIRPKYRPEENVWPLLYKMLDAGMGNRVALATDLAESNQWSYLGGSPGPTSFITKMRNRLTSSHVPPETIEMVTGGNIVRRLTLNSHRES